jgi:hypothetical protein
MSIATDHSAATFLLTKNGKIAACRYKGVMFH